MGAPRRSPASQPAPGSPDKPGISGPGTVGAPRRARGCSRPASPARAHTYCCRGCRSRRGAAGPGGSTAPCPRLRATEAAAAPSDRKPDPHRTTKEGGRGRRAGGPAGSQEGRPALEAEVAERGVEAGEAGKQVAGRSEPEPPRVGAGRRGQPSAPGSPSGHCGRGEPRCGSRSLGPAARAPTSNFPRAARRPGAGAGGRDQSARGSCAPSPAAARLQTRWGCGEQPRSPPTPGREGLQRVTEEWSRGGLRTAAQAQPPSLPLAGLCRILATRRLGVTGRPTGPHG